MYALGCSSAVVQIIFHPLCRHMIYKCHIGKERVIWKTGTVDFGDITNVDIISCILGYSMGIMWLYTAFFVRHADTIPFFWIMQDIRMQIIGGADHSICIGPGRRARQRDGHDVNQMIVRVS